MAEDRDGRLHSRRGATWRSAGQRDSDRILYSSAFARLGTVTQVVPHVASLMAHNRLTHSLKVAQVGQRTAQYLLHKNPVEGDPIDPDVLYAAGLAHDLGHPPFGHVAELALDQQLRAPDYRFRLDDGFEGNAQSFRIVTRLAQHSQQGTPRGRPEGLDLCRATLAATLKYPWLRGEHESRGEVVASKVEYLSGKFGAYGTERSELTFALESVHPDHQRATEAQIMDFADDVTYAIHDVQDFFRAGYIPLQELGYGLARGVRGEEFERFWAYATESLAGRLELEFTADSALTARKALEEKANLFPSRSYKDDPESRRVLHRFASSFIDMFQEGLTRSATGSLVIPHETEALLGVFKEMTWYYVINNSQLASLQHGQAKIVRELHQWLCVWVADSGHDELKDPRARAKTVRKRRRLPTRLVEYLEVARRERQESGFTDDQCISRAASDYIASLSDAQAIELHARLGGSHVTIEDTAWIRN